MNDVFFWTRHDEHGYCSNFYRSPIEVDGKTYPTVEHYYQARKTLSPGQQELIRNLKTPKEAKFAGYHVALRKNWDDIKVNIMLIGLRAKFTQHPNLKSKLLATGNAHLHEDSPWDKFWGYAQGQGQDMLGKLLMQVREELREKKMEEPKPTNCKHCGSKGHKSEACRIYKKIKALEEGAPVEFNVMTKEGIYRDTFVMDQD